MNLLIPVHCWASGVVMPGSDIGLQAPIDKTTSQRWLMP